MAWATYTTLPRFPYRRDVDGLADVTVLPMHRLNGIFRTIQQWEISCMHYNSLGCYRVPKIPLLIVQIVLEVKLRQHKIYARQRAIAN